MIKNSSRGSSKDIKHVFIKGNRGAIASQELSRKRKKKVVINEDKMKASMIKSDYEISEPVQPQILAKSEEQIDLGKKAEAMLPLCGHNEKRTTKLMERHLDRLIEEKMNPKKPEEFDSINS